MKKLTTIICVIFLFYSPIYTQADTTQNPLSIFGDFRFRIEQDWDSRKPDGTYRDDRTRFRLRARVGLEYQINHWIAIGSRIRTGNIQDQQGPHLTLGGNGGEFGLYQIGFEKAYVRMQGKRLTGQFGKYSFPFEKQNEIFWNDNVFPDGLSGQLLLPIQNSNSLKEFQVTAGHFIVLSQNNQLKNDAYFQAVQVALHSKNKNWRVFPGIYHFNNLSNIPDGNGKYELDYTILHLAGSYSFATKTHFSLGVDYYHNMQDYTTTAGIESVFKDQKNGFSIQGTYGALKKTGDLMLVLYYAHIQKYGIVDYFTQNDWARWDYSGKGAFGSRLSNFEGIELRIGYALDKNAVLILRTYFVEELVTSQNFTENGKRIRLDLDVKF